MADSLNTRKLEIGDELQSWTSQPISRHTLALYCGASADYNPTHFDIDFARAAGMPDVFAHGILSMAYLAHVLKPWANAQALRGFSVRFVAITQVGDAILCGAQLIERFHIEGEVRLRLMLTASDLTGQVKLQGEAVVAELPSVH